MRGLRWPFGGARVAIVRVFVTICVWGCGGKDHEPVRTEPSTADEVADDDDDPGARDAGRDAGGKNPDAPKDAGRPRDSASEPPKSDTGGTGKKDPPAPKQLMQIDECGDGNAASLTEEDIDRLKAGGKQDGMGYLYPYDQTVFPRGLMAPLLM